MEQKNIVKIIEDEHLEETLDGQNLLRVMLNIFI